MLMCQDLCRFGLRGCAPVVLTGVLNEICSFPTGSSHFYQIWSHAPSLKQSFRVYITQNSQIQGEINSEDSNEFLLVGCCRNCQANITRALWPGVNLLLPACRGCNPIFSSSRVFPPCPGEMLQRLLTWHALRNWEKTRIFKCTLNN